MAKTLEISREHTLSYNSRALRYGEIVAQVSAEMCECRQETKQSGQLQADFTAL